MSACEAGSTASPLRSRLARQAVPRPDKPLTFKDVLQEVDELLEMLRRLDATTISGETMTVLAIEDQLSQVRGRLADLVVQRMFRT